MRDARLFWLRDDFVHLRAARRVQRGELHRPSWRLGAREFFIGGDLNIELKLEDGNEEFQGRDSLDCYEM